MEVIFAIGIILTGLVGLAALIPLAANNARDTLELDRSISESTSAAASGLVQSFNDLGTLVIFDKPASGSTLNVNSTYDYVPTNGMQTVQWKVTTQSNLHPPINATPPPTIVFEKLESPGYGHMAHGSGLSAGICIDPLGMPELNLANEFVDNPTSTNPFTAVATGDSAFDHSRFPYYGERYNVLAPPNDQIGPVGSPAVATPTTPVWPMSPRMWRATLKSPLYVAGSPLRRQQLAPASALQGIFRGSGGLSPFSGENKDDPSSVLISRTNVAGSFVDASRDTSSDYTWFATLTPPFLGGNSFRQSIVVVRQRQAPVPQRRDDPLALRKDNYTIDDPDDNPSAERLTWINPVETIGFNGGAGGDVRVYGSQAIGDDIKSGEWVMLSRQPHILSPAVVPTGPAVHRWYRVLRADDAEYVSGYVWPGGTHDVWRRWVTLAGPDWIFQDEVPPANTSPIDDTFCTIVTGAVSVIDSEVVIQ